MTSPTEPGRLTDEESADLLHRVERFRTAWKSDGSTGLEWFLPPPDAPHRLAVLVQIVIIDMERRAGAGMPFRVEQYMNLFPDELSTDAVPPALLIAEYRLRHRFTDKPPLSQYQRWFPVQHDAMAAHLAAHPLTGAGPGDHTPVASIHPLGGPGERLSTIIDARRPPRAPDQGAAGLPPDVLPIDTPYRLIRKLGSGAFGEVFEARAPGEIPVAIKRIMRSLDHPASVAEKEALEAIKRLSHPFLLKTNAFWVFADRLVIVMELADGSLADRIAHYQAMGHTGVPPEELVPLFEQAGKALDYLHSENVSHRDIKPENILVLKGYAKIADFGLARLQEHTMTVVDSTVGTPAYMAPEMWQQKVSLQSDQYSLAATYVRARIGRPLFSTNILVDMANSHINTTPSLDPLPVAEQRVLLKALAKNPDARYATCQEFAEALRAAVFPPPPEPPKTRERGPNMLILTISVAVAVAVAVALVNVFVPRGEPSKPTPSDVAQKPPPVIYAPQQKIAKPPEGWTAVASYGDKLIGDKLYPLRVSRSEADETLVAILIYPTPDTDDPDPFYMLETKITNRVFAKVWDAVEKDTTSELHLWADRKAYAPDDWKKGAVDHAVKAPESPAYWLGITGAQADVPVRGVTVPQAILVARKLGGELPVRRQWIKAADAAKPKPGQKPPAGDPLAEGLGPDEVRAQLATRNVGLGRTRPLPATAGNDTSIWGIRQLVSNGREWLGQFDKDDDSKRIRLTPLPQPSTHALLIGRDYSELDVMSFEAIRHHEDMIPLNEVKGAYGGFRLVLKPGQ